MPKNPLKNFARRKSSGNVLDMQPEQPSEQQQQPAQSSFRVLERPIRSAAGEAPSKRMSSARPLSMMPFHTQRGKSTEELGGSNNRGSGTTTLSGSSGYYDTSSSSARYSSSSTLPSSFDQENEAAQDELFPAKPAQMHQDQASAGAPAHHPNPSFSSRASRAMSFGLRSRRPESQVMMTSGAQDHVHALPDLPDLPDNAAIRDRAMTVSSYASTAVPPRLEANLGNADFSSDFGNMFEGLGDSKKEMTLPPPPRALGGYMRSDSEPAFPLRATQRHAATPSPDPEPQRNHRPQQLAPTKRYSWQSRTSHDGLMSPALDLDMSSPRSSEFSQDTVKAPIGFSRFRPGYQPVPIRNSSPAHDQADSQPSTPGFYGVQPLRQVSVSSEEEVSHSDESRPMSEEDPSVLASAVQKRLADPPSPPLSRYPAAVASIREDMSSNESQNTTPRMKNLQPRVGDDSMFDISPAGPASRALPPGSQQRLGARSSSPPKRMTKAQFEKQRAAPEDEESASSGSEDGYDDGDEDERQAELARQRRKQEANMSVYRQQMKKVSGGTPSELPTHMQRPSIERASLSAPSLQQGMAYVPEGVEEEEDDDVPLGILQAHGFPNKNRPPVHVGGGSAPPTPGSHAGSVMGDGVSGALPPFARRLPQLPPDPYFGAGLVNPANRESLAFGAAPAGSVYGSSAPAVQPVHPGGLVGVIAGEERARAARRGSPNAAAGGFGSMPLPNNMQMQMPGLPRSNSNMSMMSQMGGQMPYMSPMQQGMPPMMNPMQMDNQQQMIQMMQMQQQMMQSLIQMQAGQQPNFPMQQSPSQQSLGNGFLGPNAGPPPMSMMGNNMQAPNGGRTMSMMHAPPQWGENPAQGRSNTMGSSARPMGYAGSVYNYNLSAPAPGYTPSIAPSERSNIGMPSRYRPVATNEANVGNSRSQTMTSNMDIYARQNGSNPSLLGVNPQAPKSTIRVIDKPKGAPKSPTRRNIAEEEDDDEGWAAMRQKRAARKMKNNSLRKEPALSELYTTMD